MHRDISKFVIKVGEKVFMPLRLYQTQWEIWIRPNDDYQWVSLSHGNFRRDSLFMEYHKDDSTLQRINAGKCDGFESHTQALLTKRRSREKLKAGYNHTQISKSWNFYYRLVNQVQTNKSR